MSTTEPTTTKSRHRRPLATAAAVLAVTTAITSMNTLATVTAADAADGTSSSRFVRLIQEDDPQQSRTEILDLPGLPVGAPKQLAISTDGLHAAVIGSDNVVYWADLSAVHPAFNPLANLAGDGWMLSKRVDLDSQVGTGFLQLVVVAMEGRMFHRTKPDAGGWSPWGEPSLVGGIYKDVSVSIDGYGNAHYAAISQYDEAVYRIRYPNGTWSNWELVPEYRGGAPQKGSRVSLAALTRTDLPDQCFENLAGPDAQHSWSPNAAVILSAIDLAGRPKRASKLLGKPFYWNQRYTTGAPAGVTIVETEVVVRNQGTGAIGTIFNVGTDGKIYPSTSSRDLIGQNFFVCDRYDFPGVGPVAPLRVGTAGISAHATALAFALITNE